jgi:hypothetical protein
MPRRRLSSTKGQRLKTLPLPSLKGRGELVSGFMFLIIGLSTERSFFIKDVVDDIHGV